MKETNSNIHFLNTENEINKVLKEQKKTNDPIRLLYISLWDERCQNLVNHAIKFYDFNEPLYIVDSFTMPHSFVIFNVNKAPCLITLDKDVIKEDYLSFIYNELGL